MRFQRVIRAGVAGSGNTLVQLVLRYLLGKDMVTGTHGYIAPCGDVGIIITHRDCRSVLASALRKRQQEPTRNSIKTIYNNFFTPMYILDLRYPDFFDNYDYLMDQLQVFLEIKIEAIQRSRVKSEFSMDSNLKKIGSLGLKKWSEVDAETQLHGRHIGTGHPESWKTFFPEELHAFINNLMWSELVESGWEKEE